MKPSRISKLGKLLGAAVRVVFNGTYGDPLWQRSQRSWLTDATLQDMRLDYDKASRQDIVSKARRWERKNAIVQKLCDVFEQYTVGDGGIVFTPASGSDLFNTRATEEWDGWCKNCDLTSRANFATVQSQVARNWFIDGEVFIFKTTGKSGRPRIQLIDSHRVKTPESMAKEEGKTVCDGIGLDANQRPVIYYVQEGKEYKAIPSDKMVHIFEPSRIGQYRGLSFLHAVLNDIHDLDDLQQLEMLAAKACAEPANIFTSETGEVDISEVLRTGRSSVTNDGDTERRTDYYKEAIGGRTLVLKPNEKFEQHKNDRPSVASQQYWDYLTSKICAGCGISKLLVMPWSMQGTVTRADLDSQAAFFRSRSQTLITGFTDIYETAIGGMVAKPSDWKKVNARPPRSVNVDVGRNSNAVIAELQEGLRTYEDIYGELGYDWRERVTQLAKERAFIAKLAAQYGLTVEDIIRSTQKEPQPTGGNNG
jgi:capsid protein